MDIRWYLIVVLIFFSWLPILLSIIAVVIGNLCIFFGEMSIHIICPFFKCFLFVVELLIVIFSRYRSFIKYIIWKSFLPFCVLSFHCLDLVVSFEAKIFHSNESLFIYFCCCCLCFCVISKNLLQKSKFLENCPCSFFQELYSCSFASVWVRFCSWFEVEVQCHSFACECLCVNDFYHFV